MPATNHRPNAAIVVTMGKVKPIFSVVIAPIILAWCNCLKQCFGGIWLCHADFVKMFENCVYAALVGNPKHNRGKIAEAVAPCAVLPKRIIRNVKRRWSKILPHFFTHVIPFSLIRSWRLGYPESLVHSVFYPQCLTGPLRCQLPIIYSF